MYMCHNFFIHSSVDGHLVCFHVLAIVNSAAMNNGIHVSFSILVSSGYMPRSGIARLYGGFIPSFSLIFNYLSLNFVIFLCKKVFILLSNEDIFFGTCFARAIILNPFFYRIHANIQLFSLSCVIQYFLYKHTLV